MLVEWEREAIWRTHVDACRQQAGLQRDYCREHGLSPRDLRKWRTRFFGPMRHRTSEVAVGAHAEAGPEEFSYARTEGSPPEAVAGMPVIRRRWTLDQKRQPVREGLNSGMPLSRFAREQGITPSAAYRWLREFANPVLASTPEASGPALASMHVAAPAAEPVRQASSHLAPEMVEIELADGPSPTRRAGGRPDVPAPAGAGAGDVGMITVRGRAHPPGTGCDRHAQRLRRAVLAGAGGAA